MHRRKLFIDTIQSLSRDESTRQPTAADWLADQDKKAKQRRDMHPEREAGHDYKDGLPDRE